MNEAYLKEIRGYLDREGRLTQLPIKYKKKMIALYYLADRLPPDKRYTEREFNALLNTLHSFGDPATLRRELFDAYQIDRDKDGRNYCLARDRRSLEELLGQA